MSDDKSDAIKKTPIGVIVPRKRAVRRGDETRKVHDPAKGGASAAERDPRMNLLLFVGVRGETHRTEQALRRKGFHITAVRSVDQVRREWDYGVHSLTIVDYTVDQTAREAVLELSMSRHRPKPVMLILDDGDDDASFAAIQQGATACVVRDDEGAYLTRIMELLDSFAKANDILPTKVLESEPPTEAVIEDLDMALHAGSPSNDPADVLDLVALAAEVHTETVEVKLARLAVLYGPDRGKEVNLTAVHNIVGRDPTCYLRLEDEGISRFHASLKQQADGTVVIKDLDSTNGTFVNGRRVKRATLSQGDHISLGVNTILLLKA